MLKFKSYDPEMPEWIITDENSFDVFNDILRHDDDKVVRKLLKQVLESGTVFMKVVFLEVISAQLEDELNRLETAESEAQRDSFLRSLQFVFSIEQQIARAVDDIVNGNYSLLFPCLNISSRLFFAFFNVAVSRLTI